ncbi:hypothetical protein ES332_A07G140100v1 [Gossypium tomentosum]|uniref:Uncharacterized protein n=1 Tax=Gossypium tomentosum TaxID=34277 RepID=A0A5D2PSR1_GOSTO|nr:hypothetical protein ES332_A07G140100v1 [Gossypium tomentosum]
MTHSPKLIKLVQIISAQVAQDSKIRQNPSNLFAPQQPQPPYRLRTLQQLRKCQHSLRTMPTHPVPAKNRQTTAVANRKTKKSCIFYFLCFDLFGILAIKPCVFRL